MPLLRGSLSARTERRSKTAAKRRNAAEAGAEARRPDHLAHARAHARALVHVGARGGAGAEAAVAAGAGDLGVPPVAALHLAAIGAAAAARRAVIGVAVEEIGGGGEGVEGAAPLEGAALLGAAAPHEEADARVPRADVIEGGDVMSEDAAAVAAAVAAATHALALAAVRGAGGAIKARRSQTRKPVAAAVVTREERMVRIKRSRRRVLKAMVKLPPPWRRARAASYRAQIRGS